MKKRMKILALLQRLCFPCVIGGVLGLIFACSDDGNGGNKWDKPYDPSLPVKITSFTPDSGGMTTEMIIRGENLGNDPKAVKVYFNKKQAAVVSTRGDMLYAITPRLPGDTCVISVVIGKDSVSLDDRFRYFTTTRVTTISGHPNRDSVANGLLISAAFKDPRFLTIDAQDNIFVCEWSNQAIRRINMEKGEVTTLIGEGGMIGGSPNAPDVDSDGKVVIVPMDSKFTFYEFDPERLWEAKKFEMLKADDSDNFTCEWKHGVASCQIDGMMYTRSHAGEIIKFDPKTKKAWLVSRDIETGNDSFLAFHPSKPELLYISLYNSKKIGIFNVQTKEYKQYSNGIYGYQDGDIKDARFKELQQITFDADGNLYVADAGNRCIRRISPDGIVTTVVGLPNEDAGYKDGDPSEALFKWPSGVAVDSEGTVYVADRDNNCIRKLSIE